MNRPPLLSRIPPEHPHKDAIEAVCQRFLDNLGPEWFISITPSSNPQVWEVCLGRRRAATARPHNRNWVMRPPAQKPDSFERALRDAATHLRTRMQAGEFGMEPAGNVDADRLDQLRDLVFLLGGRMSADGWITLPDPKAWQRLQSRASEELQIQLVASVR